MGYIKNCNHIIFYSKLLTLCSRISFIEFRQKCVYNSAIHTWYSCPCCPCGNVPFYDVKQIKSTSPELLCLTFKIHPQESNLHKAALVAISSGVIMQSTGGHCIRKPGPAVQPGLESSERWTRGSECVSLTLPEHQQGFTIITLFGGNGKYLFKRILWWSKNAWAWSVLSPGFVNDSSQNFYLKSVFVFLFW